MKAIVWSKDQCAFCEQAKSLLEMKGIEYEVRNISQDWTREQLLESVPTARSVPQIFLDEEYVGGFQELRQRLMYCHNSHLTGSAMHWSILITLPTTYKNKKQLIAYWK
jgi:glutaredoxin 3